MRILAVSDGMTGGTALLEDGKIVYAVHEERLIRAKMATGFPRASIDKILADTRGPKIGRHIFYGLTEYWRGKPDRSGTSASYTPD